MQAVIVAGGLATRLSQLTVERPKSMIPILGVPFIQYQLELLSRSGIDDVVYCLGHLGEQIENFVGDGKKYGVNVVCSYDGDVLLGTGGALKKAEQLLHDTFFLLWGDSYLMLDYKDINQEFAKRNYPAMMVVYKNNNEQDKSNVLLKDGIVARYDKWNPTPDMVYIDDGLTVMKKSLLTEVPANETFAIEKLFAKLANEGKLGAYETSQRFYEIGSVSGIQEFEQLINERITTKGQS